MTFRQLFDSESSTYSYIVADFITGKAAIVDPVITHVDRDSMLLTEMNLELVYTIETHVHADHITGATELKRKWSSEIVAGENTGLKCADKLLIDGEVLKVGELAFKAISTPGHTSGCTSWFVKDRVFTGDALLIRGCGRTDFQEGSAQQLYDSVRNQLFQLPEQTLVMPGHDYQGRTCSTIAEEKAHNPRLKESISEQQFVEIMDNLNLPYPKKIDESLPANKQCGKI